MQTDATIPRKVGRIFYFAAITLLLVAIAAADAQKRRESAVGMAEATRIADNAEETDEYKSNVQNIIQDAAHWQILSFAAVLLAIVSWCIALWRREKHRWMWVCIIVLLSLYAMLELIMV